VREVRPNTHLEHDLEIYFNLNDYLSFTRTKLDSCNVKISGNLKQKLGPKPIF
jgi:hypothetical protein